MEKRTHPTRHYWFWMLVIVSLLALACNAPFSASEIPPAPELEDDVNGETEDAESDSKDSAENDNDDENSDTDDVPVATVTRSDDSEAADEESGDDEAVESDETEETPLPTFTPIQEEPTIAATATTAPPPTATRPAATATATTAASSGPLAFDFSISWAVVPGDDTRAVATVAINATGGNGEYTYYRDGLVVAGPIFTFEWATCRANPGSLRVDSSDGQSVTQDYYSDPPCPESQGG